MSNPPHPAKTRSSHLRAPLHRTFLPFLLAIPLAVCSSSLPAQTSLPASPESKVAPALVTFVSNPSSLTAGLPGHQSEGFTGKLFVDHDLLANIRAGRFITISFVPGAYEFTATTWMANGPAGGGHLKLELAAHHHYYVELRMRQSFPVTKMFGIKQIACEEAFRNNARDKPLDPSALLAAGKSNAITETSFPACPETN